LIPATGKPAAGSPPLPGRRYRLGIGRSAASMAASPAATETPRWMDIGPLGGCRSGNIVGISSPRVEMRHFHRRSERRHRQRETNPPAASEKRSYPGARDRPTALGALQGRRSVDEPTNRWRHRSPSTVPLTLFRHNSRTWATFFVSERFDPPGNRRVKRNDRSRLSGGHGSVAANTCGAALQTVAGGDRTGRRMSLPTNEGFSPHE